MEPRVVPVKYTTEINFNLHSPTRRFTETIDMQVLDYTYIFCFIKDTFLFSVENVMFVFKILDEINSLSVYPENWNYKTF